VARSTAILNMQLRQPRLRSGAWERLRGVHMEKTGSKSTNVKDYLSPLFVFIYNFMFDKFR